MATGAILIEGTAVEQETVNEGENENKIERFTVEREIDIDVRIELKRGHPNLDYYRDPDSVHEYVQDHLNDGDRLFHSIDIESVRLALYDVEEQAKVFASERPDLSVEDAKEKMLRWSNMDDIRYGK